VAEQRAAHLIHQDDARAERSLQNKVAALASIC
jgi:hypothetical protein